jgi:hypothetical protein
MVPKVQSSWNSVTILFLHLVTATFFVALRHTPVNLDDINNTQP